MEAVPIDGTVRGLTLSKVSAATYAFARVKGGNARVTNAPGFSPDGGNEYFEVYPGDNWVLNKSEMLNFKVIRDSASDAGFVSIAYYNIDAA